MGYWLGARQALNPLAITFPLFARKYPGINSAIKLAPFAPISVDLLFTAADSEGPDLLWHFNSDHSPHFRGRGVGNEIRNPRFVEMSPDLVIFVISSYS